MKKYSDSQCFPKKNFWTKQKTITSPLQVKWSVPNTVPVTSGVPQGTVLVPIIFLIYINDFPEYLAQSKLRLFADDSIIYKEITCRDDCKKLQSDFDAAARWDADWLMAFHPDKCTVLAITQKKTPFKHDYIYTKQSHSRTSNFSKIPWSYTTIEP